MLTRPAEPLDLERAVTLPHSIQSSTWPLTCSAKNAYALEGSPLCPLYHSHSTQQRKLSEAAIKPKSIGNFIVVVR